METPSLSSAVCIVTGNVAAELFVNRAINTAGIILPNVRTGFIIEIPKPSTCDLYVAVMGESASLKSFEIIKAVRSCGLIAETDIVGRGLRAQMKYADKIGAKFSMVLGDNEIEQGKAVIKNMSSGEQTEIVLDDTFAEKFMVLQLADVDSFKL